MQTLLKIIAVVIIGVGVVSYFSPDARKALSGMTKIFKLSQKDSGPQPISKAAVTQLIKDDMQRFAVSINNKNMAQFYAQLSDFWQARTSVKDLNEVFAPYINSGIDLTVLKNMTPVIDKGPKVTNNADLHVTGHYNTTPSVLQFKQTYYLQGTGEWKLAEFFVEVKKK